MKNIFLLLMGVLLFCSCTTYYGSANFSEESSVYLKLSYRDSIVTAEYLSASFNRGVAISQNTFEYLAFGSFSYNKSYTKEYFNYAYGGYAHIGGIKFTENNLKRINSAITENTETTSSDLNLIAPNSYFYAGGGISGEINFNIPFKNLDWRIIGLKMTLGYEDGSYSNFREDLIQKATSTNNEIGGQLIISNDFANTNENNISFNLSVTSELIFKLKNADLGWTYSFGVGNQLLTTSNSLYYSQNRITGFAGFNTSIQGAIFKTGVAYRLR